MQLRISVTDGCQLSCRYCKPEGSFAVRESGHDGLLSYEEIVTLAGCLHGEIGLSKIRLTGGEPLTRPRLDRLVGMLADLGIPDIALTTNGLLLAGMAACLKQAGLRRVNVSLDSLAPDTFRRLTGGGDLKAVLRGIEAALAADLRPLKLNTVVIRGTNDHEVGELVAFGLRSGCEVRFIELMPIGSGAALFDGGFMDCESVRRRLTARFRFRPLPWEPGSSARRYAVRDAAGNRGVVGLIASCSAPFCAGCTRLRVTADGRLIGCLARNGGVSIRHYLSAGDRAALIRVARGLLSGKRRDRIFRQDMTMASIGG